MGHRKGRVRAFQKAACREREDLERKWRDRMEDAPELGRLVVRGEAGAEPFHRWTGYRQGFSPELVRLFMEEAPGLPGLPLLDPFSGTGTLPIEAALRGAAAAGVDAVAALAFLGSLRNAREIPDWPGLAGLEGAGFDALLREAPSRILRGAALIALARSLDPEGRPRPGGEPPAARTESVLAMMREDVAQASGRPDAWFLHGDARRLPFRDGFAGGVLTSPPYLSRHDYTRINSEIEARLHPGDSRTRRRSQIRATPAIAGRGASPAHPAAAEAARQLRESGHPRIASLVLGYFADMDAVLSELQRVCPPGAPVWINVAGADLKREYIPADLILSEMAVARGFKLHRIQVARRVRPQGRSLGGLRHVAPREVILRLETNVSVR